MIHEIMQKGTSFEKRIKYIFNLTKSADKQEKVNYICGSLFAINPITKRPDGSIQSVDVQPMIDEFQIQANKYIPRTGSNPKLVFHSAVSLAPGETLSRTQWRKLGKAYMHALGFKDSQWVQVQHSDSKLEHCHFVANRVVERDGKYRLVTDSMDRDKGMSVMRQFEKEFELNITSDPEYTDEISYNQREVNKATRTGQLPWRKVLLDSVIVARDASHGKSWSYFIEACEALGVGVNTRLNDAGTCVGVSFEYKGKVISGRKLKAAATTFQKLTKLGGINHVESAAELSNIEEANSRFEARQSGNVKVLVVPRTGTEKAFEDSIAIEGEVILSNEQEIEQMPFIPISVQEITFEMQIEYLVLFNFVVPTSTPALKKEKKAIKKIFDGKYTGDISSNNRYSAMEITGRMLRVVFGNKNINTRYVEYTTGEENVLTLAKIDLCHQPADFGIVRDQLANTMNRNGLGYKQENLDILATKNLLDCGWARSDLISHISESQEYSNISAVILVTKAMLCQAADKKNASNQTQSMLYSYR